MFARTLAMIAFIVPYVYLSNLMLDRALYPSSDAEPTPTES